MEETTSSNSRTRLNLKQTAKGAVQWDITAEYDMPEQAIAELGKSIDLVKTLLAEKGLKGVEV